jgi:hypothetical protein
MNGRWELGKVWPLLGLVVATLVATAHPIWGADGCALSLVDIEEIRARAEARCEQRGMTCETGVLDYVRCVNAAVAAGVSRGRIPRECRRTAEVSPARCTQPRPPGPADVQ